MIDINAIIIQTQIILIYIIFYILSPIPLPCDLVQALISSSLGQIAEHLQLTDKWSKGLFGLRCSMTNSLH
jgi:hypothetical protein